MKQLTIKVEESRFQTFLEFLKTLDYVKFQDDERNASESLQESLSQVALMREGKFEKQLAEDFLNDL